MAKRSILDWISLVLVIIGGLNWGLIGLFNFDLIRAILGSIPVLQKVVYVLVGIAALYTIYYINKK